MTEDQTASLPDSLREMTWWMFDNTCIGIGAHRQFDYTLEGSLGPDLNPRLGRCYELAAKAFNGWDEITARTGTDKEGHRGFGLPAPTRLVHGTWRGKEPQRIGHAWVILEDDRIWEPITGLICEARLFFAYTRGVSVRGYRPAEVRVNMLTAGHFGPWHKVDRRGCPR